MNKVVFYGNINCPDHKIIASLLKSWINADNLRIKIRLIGEEITYENENFYFYCYSHGEPEFLLEGFMFESLQKTRALLQALFQIFQVNNIKSRLECVEEDENGNEIGDYLYIN